MHRSSIKQLITRLHAQPPYAHTISYSSPHSNALDFSNMLKFFHSQMGAQNDVVTLFAQMQKSGLWPDVFVYPTLIKSVGNEGIVLHAHVLKLGFGCDKYIRNAMMDVHAKCGPIEVARQLFDEMCDKTVADWNVMVSGYWNWGCEVEACKLFDLMPQRNVISWTTMITGYSKVKDLKSARRYFDEMPQKNIVSCNAMLSGYAQNGFAEEAMRLFNEMMTSGIQPNATTWVAVISSCSSLGDPCLAESLVKMLDEKHAHLNYFVKTALLDMHAKCGSLETAREIFDELGVRKNSVTWNAMISGYTRVGDLTSARELFDRVPKRNVVSWNSMIAGYAQNGQSAMALELFQEMAATKDFKPDEVTMVSVLSACGHLGALELGNWVANFLTKNRIKLSISGYNSLIFMYSKCGSMNDARKVFQKMAARDVISYNTLITGFAAYGHGSEALKLMLKMKCEELRKKMRNAGYIADKSCVLRDVEEEEKEEMVGTHSEKLAIAFALLVSEAGAVIRVVKNLRVCWDCHMAIMMISELERREIMVRDNNRFHCFSSGQCSCNDYW
ncbi:pentatricopeptide repeat (PPR) superfamily protein [Actinidia rufa]|uniref:Pentatricopeptide repeat (PPR) superfamily protein n=1 Tax=Actinidia rufa TaxID=165716 RepID=A0A7J0ERY9_9ERIC|nr:pentatricopeptide repeat (PPR) superfamily protein [Actinidia rufa]